MLNNRNKMSGFKYCDIVRLVIVTSCILGATSVGSISPKSEAQSVVADIPWDGALVGPSFDTGPESVVVSVGSTAYLACRVRQLGDRKVSWIRKRDLHILTFGQVTYTNDARFSVIKSATGDLWTLRIRSVQLRDAGLYECQVSSEPKISKAVRLKVVVSQAYIHGSPEMYIRSGSDISLSCVAKDMPEPPSHFTWYKGLQILSTGGNDGHQLFQQNSHLQQQQQHQMNANKQTSFFGKSSIMTSLSGRKVTIETSQHGLENLLLIRNAVAADSGNYTCIPAGAEPASIVVHVLNGEHPAAMQHGHGGISRTQPGARFQHYVLLATLLLSLHRYLSWNRQLR
ncbi:uncharacterized protein LOC116928968 [Daphnia magna]|uniref:uncharacterized protein LOC116928968 n=1 Tax=Daphnia magna TaxID=35525 RepID=UPI0006E0738F|nr:uncharacterized protein LOC116928968 [Daphnia magna]